MSEAHGHTSPNRQEQKKSRVKSRKSAARTGGPGPFANPSLSRSVDLIRHQAGKHDDRDVLPRIRSPIYTHPFCFTQEDAANQTCKNWHLVAEAEMRLSTNATTDKQSMIKRLTGQDIATPTDLTEGCRKWMGNNVSAYNYVCVNICTLNIVPFSTSQQR